MELKRESADPERRIKELAETLLRRGLAMTKDSARNLAQSMIETEERVQRQFAERKEGATRYGSGPRNGLLGGRYYNEADKPVQQSRTSDPSLKELHRDYRDAEQSSFRKSKVDEFRDRALNPRPVAVQTEYDVPWAGVASPREELRDEDFIELKPKMTVAEAAGVDPLRVDKQPISRLTEASPGTEPFTDEDSDSLSGDSLEAESSLDDDDGALAYTVSVDEGETPTSEGTPTGSDAARDVAEGSVPRVEPYGEADLEEYVGDRDVRVRVVESSETPSAQELLDETTEEREADESEFLDEGARPHRVDLGKKHGIDLSSIFNVNK